MLGSIKWPFMKIVARSAEDNCRNSDSFNQGRHFFEQFFLAIASTGVSEITLLFFILEKFELGWKGLKS